MDIKNKGLMSLGAALLILTPGISSAEINDSPYFALWEETKTVNGVAGNGSVANGTQVGGVTSVQLCGTANCAGNATTANDYATFSSVIDLDNAKGSGKIRSFLRFQHNEGDANGSADTEAAFNTNNPTKGTITNPTGSYPTDNSGSLNTSVSTIENQAKDTTAGPGDDFNHAIKYTDLLAEGLDFSFFLDINEPNGGPGGAFSTLRLEELALFVSTSDQLNAFTRDAPNTYSGNTWTGGIATSGFTDGAAFKVWDMDFNEYDNGGTELGNGGGGTNNIGGLILDNINDTTGGQGGSGDYDMRLDIKKDLFEQVLAANGIAADDAYVYLYNFAGEAEGGNGANADTGEAAAGFEEWAALLKLDSDDDTPPSGGTIPEPGTAFLFLTGLAGAYRLTRGKSC